MRVVLSYGEHGIGRVYARRQKGWLPTVEEFIVAGPAGAEDKAMPNFEAWWEEALEGEARGPDQLALV
jgi:hypothetical protein